MKRLLLVEDDPLIAKTLKLSLQYRGYEVNAFDSIAKGRAAFESEAFDLIVLDVNLPDGNGYSLCKEIREKNAKVPILMLTARVDEVSAVQGIESGADDYVRKPFGLEELTARLNRLLGRKAGEEDELRFQSIRMSLKQRQVWIGETPLTLYKREFEILALLVRRGGEVVSREEILNTLDKDGELFDRTIDSHLSHLRKKLKEANLTNVQISPVYGVGYRLEAK